MIADAACSPLWQGYVDYCRQGERGLRSDALAKLESFIVEMEQASFEERQRFVSWLMLRVSTKGRAYPLCPYPLNSRIVKPTLHEWTVVEPYCSEPHRWLGGYEHLKIASNLDPTDLTTRRMLIGAILNRISMNTHEIPSGYGYMGVPNEGFADLDEAETLANALPTSEERNKAAKRIDAERFLIRQYVSRLQEKPIEPE